jgi:hypothetical protein
MPERQVQQCSHRIFFQPLPRAAQVESGVLVTGAERVVMGQREVALGLPLHLFEDVGVHRGFLNFSAAGQSLKCETWPFD